MKLLSVETLTTPYLSQVGLYETRSGEQISIYFRSSGAMSAPKRTDHFFLIGALAAYLRGEKYVHAGLVDRDLYERFHSAMRRWQTWWRKRPINISAELSTSGSELASPRSASLMSGGVDSLFTLNQSAPAISALVHVIHAHRPGAVPEASAHFKKLGELAAAMNKDLIGVETNIMTAFREIEDSWARISHGACMAAIGHFLNGEIDELIISASFAEDQLRPWGSHPDIDPLMSSADMTYRHEGAAYTRFEKHREIASDATLLRHLSVCEHGPQSGEHVNCSKCQKCLRSMITLDLLAVDRAAAPSFDWSNYHPSAIKRFLLPGHVNCSELLAYAEKVGRADIANVLRDAIAYAEKHHWIVKAELFARRRFNWALKYKRTLKRLRRAVYGMLNIRMRRL